MVVRALVLAVWLGASAGAVRAQSVDLTLMAAQAEAGDPAAQIALALIYHEGLETAQNFSLAAEWALKAADQGNAVAQNLLGRYAYSGFGMPVDQDAAVKWLSAAAAQQNNPQYLFDLGVALETGADGSNNPEAAASAYEAAAVQGHTDAAVSLGVLLQDGRGVDQDFDRARALYEAAAENGNARAQNNLGLLYVRGNGVTQDYSRAVGLFEAAAEQGLQPAMRNLGVMYENGFGVKLDEDHAAALYRAAGDSVPASDTEKDSGLAYDIRLMQPTEDSAQLTRQAAAGDPVAQFQLGWVLATAEDASHADFVEAAQLFRNAAKSGYAPAMVNLGILHFQGKGAAQDYVLGQMWLTLAASFGSQSAQDALARFEGYATATQINEAQHLAQEYSLQP